MIKLILLAILAWYVFKTAGNLIRALRGQPERPLGPSRPGTGSGTRQDPSMSHRASTHVPTQARTKEDVEDARFVDLP
ncbi:MAG: hypothetical protein RIE53_12115 [Rhodothermales bacterium]